MTFEDLGLAPRLAQKLTDAGLTDPTPIQREAIPHALGGRDVMGLAQTGTGKTLAFGLPLLNRIGGDRAKGGATLALVLAPTRELAKQIMDQLIALAGNGGPRVQLIVGGKSINAQSQRMQRGCEILVATPGRLIDLMERNAVRLNEARTLVLDEADQMLDMGFIHALRKIAPALPADRQTMLFSATMPKQMEELAAIYLDDPVRIEVAPPGKPADKIEQSVHFVQKADKQALLVDMLDGHRDERAIVFARTKHGAERLMKSLDGKGFAAASIHGNKSQGQRDRALDAFRAGRVRVLVATDVAARGIDIPAVAYVYNYELPNVPENYVHRIGRTARAGAEGQAISFCAPDEAGEFRDIEKTLGRTIPVAGGMPWPGSEPAGRGRKPGRPGQRPSGGKPGGQRPRRRRPRPKKVA